MGLSMKKIVVVVCTVAFALGLAGCAGKAKAPVPVAAPEVKAVVKTKG